MGRGNLASVGVFLPRQNAPGGPLQPRISRKSNAESTTVTRSDPAHPSRLEKKTNILTRSFAAHVENAFTIRSSPDHGENAGSDTDNDRHDAQSQGDSRSSGCLFLRHRESLKLLRDVIE